MSKKHKGGPAPNPKGNRSHAGPEQSLPQNLPPTLMCAGIGARSEATPRGTTASAGEHPIEQPDGKQGANQ